jgi:hypothetical protein
VKTIITLEGIGTAQNPHPLQRAFAEEQAGALRLLWRSWCSVQT